MSEQLSLFPELNYTEYEYRGKIYKRYTGGGKISYRRKMELEYKVKRFIDEYKKTI